MENKKNAFKGTNNNILIIILLSCFFFQQIGYSLHFSFGSAGLFILLIFFYKNISPEDIKISIYLSLSLVFCVMINIMEFGYSPEVFKSFRLILNAFILFLLMNKRNALTINGRYNLILFIILLIVLSLYQIFIDSTFQLDQKYFSIDENLGIQDNDFVSNTYILRTNAIYSEPSYFGMILACCFGLILNSNNFYPKSVKVSLLIMIGISIFLSGTGLGFAGIILFAFDYIYRLRNKKNLLINIIPLLVLFFTFYYIKNNLNSDYNFSIYERIIAGSNVADDSASTRFLYPFYLIIDNLKNGRIFGILFNNFQHFLSTGLYVDGSDFPMHNGIINLIINYGLFGLLYIFTIYRNLRSSTELIFILLIGVQNGNLFSYEKVFSMLFIIFMYRAMANIKDRSGK